MFKNLNQGFLAQFRRIFKLRQKLTERKTPEPNLKPSLSREKIANGMKSAFLNAESLLRDAEILFKKKSFPRSFSLSVHALEEVSKITLLANLLFKTDSRRRPVTLKGVLRKFRSHDAKLTEFMANSLINDHLYKQEVSYEAIRKMPHGELGLSEMRERGFYVSYEGGKFVMPSQYINESLAREAIEKVKEHLAIFSKSMRLPEKDIAAKLYDLQLKMQDPLFRSTRQKEADDIIKKLQGKK